MGITIHNTMSRRKEDFETIKQKTVTMYVCGVTPYDFAHLGHARAAAVFDNVRRFLQMQGYAVEHLTNFTDVDDKIIKRANEEGKTCAQITEYYINDYKNAMEKLNVLPPMEYALATTHIGEMISLIEKLVANGCAYPAGGDVYFDVSRFQQYGKLSGMDLEQLIAGARIEPGELKDSPEDFALWKASKPGEPVWKSPWGEGRPGWHIECSAMASKHLGDSIDIHGGGADLIFPHHENEIAQSEAASGKQFARYWMHCGLLQAGSEKMSKSLKNYFSLQDALARHHPEALRVFLASAPYRSPLKYTPESLAESEASLTRLNNCRAALEEAIEEGAFGKANAKQAVDDARKAFVAAMCDDFNTANALAAIFDLARTINSQVIGKATKEDSKHALSTLVELGNCLGFFFAPAQKKLPDGVTESWLAEKIAGRNHARKEKDFATADAIRKEVAEKGIVLEDSANGTRWRAE